MFQYASFEILDNTNVSGFALLFSSNDLKKFFMFRKEYLPTAF